MSTPYASELQAAVSAVRAAATLCRAVQAQLDPGALEKSDRSPVTVADFGSQAIVCRALMEVFPEDPVIAEEDASVLEDHPELLEHVLREAEAAGYPATARQLCGWIDRGGWAESAPRVWTLDPIDGTKGFLRGDQYAIALALIEDGRLVVGALASPNLPLRADDPDGPRGVVFGAARGQGAFQLPLDDPGAEPVDLRPSGEADLARARFCESVEADHASQGDNAEVARRLGITAEPVRLDSLTKYACVARGDAEVYLRLPKSETYQEKIWDHAAGALVVTEAGGRVTDAEGRPLDFGHGPRLVRNKGVVASSGPHHDRIVDVVRAVRAEKPKEAPQP